MKKISSLLIGILTACPTTWAQTTYLENLKVENLAAEKQGDNVRVTMDINMDELDMKSQHMMKLVPVLVAADKARQQEMEPVVITGKTRGRVIDRQVALGDITDDGTTRLRRKNGKEQTYHYETQVPYAAWMVNGQVEMRGYTTGCASCSEGDETLYAGTVLPYQEPQFLLSSVMQPQEETIKRRAEVKTARLQYKQNSYVVLPDYKNNKAELANVQQSINAVKGNSNLTITGIYVTGYASPEASAAYNLRLSQRRAETFTDYVQQKNAELSKSLWHVSWQGEDWAGLRTEVEKRPGLLMQKEVLAIIDNCDGDLDACEAKLKALSPEVYQRLLNELYGPLRRNEYRIEYNVKHFDMAEAKQLLRTRPDLLSVAEIQKVADSYGKGTEEYREALRIGAKTYPANVVACNNAALAEIETGNYDYAISTLKGTKDPTLLNLLGVAYYKTGNKQQAETSFRNAAQAGDKMATDNLRMLEEGKKYE